MRRLATGAVLGAVFVTALSVLAQSSSIGSHVGDYRASGLSSAGAVADLDMNQHSIVDVDTISANAITSGWDKYNTAVSTCTGDIVCNDNSGVIGGQRTDTTDPAGLMIRPQACSPSDGTCAAANANIFGGQDTSTIAIDGADPTVTCAGDNDTVTVTVIDSDGTSLSTVLTEGTDWTASASVATTCTSLAAAVSALVGVSASCTSPDVRIQLDATTGRVTLAESTTGCTTVATGTAGLVQVGGEDGTRLAFGGTTASNPMFITLNSGSNPFIRLKAATATAFTSNVPDGIYYGSGFNVSITDSSNSSAVSITRSGVKLSSGATAAIGGFGSTITPAAAATALSITQNWHTVDCDAGGNILATITGGPASDYMVLNLLFVDASCTITDTDAATANTVNLSAAYTSAANDVMTLLWNKTKWFELSRSVNG